MTTINADELDFHRQGIVEWYDGVLSAVLDFDDGTASCLCLVIGWSPDYHVRVYGLVPIIDDVADALRSRLGSSLLPKRTGRRSWR
jgi:hypothetical protein